MNAVIAVCHFCEAHGPCAIFCTQTLRDTIIEDIVPETVLANDCPECSSIGPNEGILSRDKESGTNFLSAQSPVFREVNSLLKQASVRSLSCEINSNNDNGFVFFGDAVRGHVLSHTFHISDIQARGFYQLFSIIVLMKDKYFLLNMQPFISDCLKKVSEELQKYALKVYQREQLNVSIRRVSGAQTIGQFPRSLVNLTDEKHIFAVIHSHFTWILLASSRHLTEHISFDFLPWYKLNIRKESVIKERENSGNVQEAGEDSPKISLRYAKRVLDGNFCSACYCVLAGIKIIIRGPIETCNMLAECLKELLPETMHHIVKLDSPHELNNPNARIVTVSSTVAVPLPNSSIFRVDLLENDSEKISIKWPGQLPDKYPTLHQSVMKAVDEALFTDLVLLKRIQMLKEEWRNKVDYLHRLKSGNDMKLRKSLDIQPKDQVIITYWTSCLRD